MEKKTIRDISVKGKKVFVRVDYNVPLDKKGNIIDDTRIIATLPTLTYLVNKGAALILGSHLGRPKGQQLNEYSLITVRNRLSELLKQHVLFASDCIGKEARTKAKTLKNGEVLLLENLRFYKEEENNETWFAKKLSKLADVAVNDAFGVSHRTHASIEKITKFLPTVAGFLIEKEIYFLDKLVNNPNRPFVAIIGGAKISDKIDIIENFLTKVDTLIIGGGMANTFIAAQNFETGKSLIEKDKIIIAKKLIAAAEEKKVNLLLPIDVVIANKFSSDAEIKVVTLNAIESNWMVLDIGILSAKKFSKALNGAKTVIWNGPLGAFEVDLFARGTEIVAKAVAKCGATTIIGGGDLVSAIKKIGITSQISHISTGGGASLKFLEGKILPGIAALLKK